MALALEIEPVFGCWQEAIRCDRVIVHLLRTRRDLGDEYYKHITDLISEVEATSRLLRDVYDLYPIYRSRGPIVSYYLDVVLPCLQKTLRDMMIYIDNDEISPRRQWVLMNDRLGEQLGIALANRFVMYFDFLVQCIRLLSSRSPLYDPTSLELLRMRILRLRLLRGIPEPQVPAQPHLATPKPTQQDFERRHWAQKIFDVQPCSATGLRHRRTSRCFGPPMIEERLGIPTGSTVLFKLPFDKNRLSVTLYLHAEGADLTRLLCRWMDPHFNPMYSCYGVHELCIRREGSAIQLRRWSNNRANSTLWMALFFKTWEKMVLFHCAFVALKARCPLTINVNPDDYKLAGEDRLFHGKIVDDGFEHSLTIFQDRRTHGIRLHAAVGSGELKKCPVWTSFVTHSSASPDWFTRRSPHRIWIKDIQLYVFCKNYRMKNQVRKRGVFEITFIAEEAADAFEEVFGFDGGSVIDNH